MAIYQNIYLETQHQGMIISLALSSGRGMVSRDWRRQRGAEGHPPLASEDHTTPTCSHMPHTHKIIQENDISDEQIRYDI